MFEYYLTLPGNQPAVAPMNRRDDAFVLKHNPGARINRVVDVTPKEDEYQPNLLTRCVNFALGTSF
jgi:hypothetical protein